MHVAFFHAYRPSVGRLNLSLRLAVFAVFVAMAPLGRAVMVIAPNVAETKEGNTYAGSAFGPWATGATTFQGWIAAGQLSDMPVGSTITGIAFRSNGGQTTAPAADMLYSDYEIRLAQANGSIGSMSTTFADNMTSPVLVRDGALTLPANSMPGGSLANAFGYTITFDTPYTYQGGDLIVHLTHAGATGGSGVYQDAITSRLGFGTDINGKVADSINATTAAYSVFFPMQLQYTAVPEPSEYAALAGAGLLGFAIWRQRSKSRPAVA